MWYQSPDFDFYRKEKITTMPPRRHQERLMPDLAMKREMRELHA
jgi:hypothetical protein